MEKEKEENQETANEEKKQKEQNMTGGIFYLLRIHGEEGRRQHICILSGSMERRIHGALKEQAVASREQVAAACKEQMAASKEQTKAAKELAVATSQFLRTMKV
jgi:hypothetical protein